MGNEIEKTKTDNFLQRLFLLLGISWTLIILSLSIWSIRDVKKQIGELLLSQARSIFEIIVTTRDWNARHGGVYVPVDKENQPNPYLDVPERDIVTDKGKKLTLINPASMTRQISKLTFEKQHSWFRLTSLNPLRPENKALLWESKALSGFKVKGDEYYDWGEDENEEKQYFRYMGSLWITKSCLRCHKAQGYSLGDLRGGISVMISSHSAIEVNNNYIKFIGIIYFLIWIVGFVGLFFVYRFVAAEKSHREYLIQELQKAIGEVKTLKGLIPICSSCKKIRDDSGDWERMEKYIEARSDVEFTHGLCNKCARELYPGIELPDEKPRSGG